MDVDMVFTYVNGNDPNYIKNKNLYVKNNSSIKKYNPEIRYVNINEIKYSVRSVLKFIPWIRKIFIVTDKQIPPIDKLLIITQKVIIIDHKQIIDNQYLPTFNSNVIESYLHNIPGLSEIFLYNNDDVLFFNNISRDDIYLTNKEKTSLKIHSDFNYNVVKNRLTHHSKIITFTCDYFKKTFPKLSLINNHHTKILRKSTLKIIEKNEQTLLHEIRKNKFRSSNYINYIFFAINIDNLFNENIIIKDYKDIMELHLGNKNYNKEIFNSILKKKPKFLCLNSMNQTYLKPFQEFMEKYI